MLVNPLGEVMEKLERAEETRDFVKPDSLYLTVGEAVASLSLSMKAKPLPMYDEEAQANPFWNWKLIMFAFWGLNEVAIKEMKNYINMYDSYFDMLHVV